MKPLDQPIPHSLPDFSKCPLHTFSTPPEGKVHETLMNLHSFLNINNVIAGILQCLNEDSCPDYPVSSLVNRIAHASDNVLENEGELLATLLEDTEVRKQLEGIAQALQISPNEQEQSLAPVLKEVLSVLDVRLKEYRDRLDSKHPARPYAPETIEQMLTRFFRAIEQNSRGKYRVVYNIAEQQPQDYLFDIRLAPSASGLFSLPPVILDVIRDLCANSRKYTLPGGRIRLEVTDSPEESVITVSDNGCGIPDDEISKVVQFGYRASNVTNTKTLGGGFGLTKALNSTVRFGGTLSIKSLLGKGTQIIIRLPHLPKH